MNQAKGSQLAVTLAIELNERASLSRLRQLLDTVHNWIDAIRLTPGICVKTPEEALRAVAYEIGQAICTAPTLHNLREQLRSLDAFDPQSLERLVEAIERQFKESPFPTTDEASESAMPGPRPPRFASEK